MKRGEEPPDGYRLKTFDFGIQESDWDKTLWSHWENRANEDESCSGLLLLLLF